MNTTENVLPLSCSCSNCDWNLCTMKTKLSKDILICCCGENPRSKQLVYTCTTGSKKATIKPIKASETCCQPKDVKKSGYEKDDKKGGKTEKKKNLKMFEKDKIDKQEKKKSLKSEKVDCICKGTKEKHSIFGTKAKAEVKKSDLYSKIEEIYKICCCELCNCPSPPTPQEKSSSDEDERKAQKIATFQKMDFLHVPVSPMIKKKKNVHAILARCLQQTLMRLQVPRKACANVLHVSVSIVRIHV
ncbi:uncharacterized protein LOC121733838 [Aricia agestis]|uniref:uncharacterized protein LOC121733838 n=1 Tax=Aricia agestis TaxID=91739 RepID=UPI001C2067AB|nr:uncharacterized protein LOC121733838 [Aricia agestis]